MFNIYEFCCFNFLRKAYTAQGRQNSEVNQYWGGGEGGWLKNKSELLSHFSSFFVCFAYIQMEIIGGGGAQAPAPPPVPPHPTALTACLI
jgi:hypothetical protein